MEIAAVFEQARAAVAALAAVTPGTLSDAEVRSGLPVWERLSAMVEAGRVAYTGELDRRAGAVPGYPRGGGAVAFQRGTLRRAHKDAKADAAIASVLADLPRLRAAFAAGEVSRSHVDVAVKAIERVPKEVWDDATRALADELLTDQAARLSPEQYAVSTRHLGARIAPEAFERFDPGAHTRRGLSFIPAAGHTVLIRGALTAADAAIVQAQIGTYEQALLRRARQARDAGELEPERRTASQLRADALVAWAHDGALQAQVVVTTTAADLDAVRRGGPRPMMADNQYLGALHPALFAQLACDAILQAVHLGPDGAVLNLGRAHRDPSPAQRLAVKARDRGCIVCAAPVAWCQVHHVAWWHRDQGPTDLANLCLLCSRCHTLVHSGVQEIRMHGGVPQVRPCGTTEWLPAMPHRLDRAKRQNQALADQIHSRQRPDDAEERPPPDEGPGPEEDPPAAA